VPTARCRSERLRRAAATAASSNVSVIETPVNCSTLPRSSAGSTGPVALQPEALAVVMADECLKTVEAMIIETHFCQLVINTEELLLVNFFVLY
jgi:hypothetical protein